MTILKIIQERRDDFEKEIEAPDVSNSASNSPKMWMFEGFISCKAEAQSHINITLLAIAEAEIKRLEGEKMSMQNALNTGSVTGAGYTIGYNSFRVKQIDYWKTVVKKL